MLLDRICTQKRFITGQISFSLMKKRRYGAFFHLITYIT